MVSYKVVKDGGGRVRITTTLFSCDTTQVSPFSTVSSLFSQLALVIQTHLTVGRQARENFACQFSSSSSELCSLQSPPAQFPQCTCVLSNGALPAEGQ